MGKSRRDHAARPAAEERASRVYPAEAGDEAESRPWVIVRLPDSEGLPGEGEDLQAFAARTRSRGLLGALEAAGQRAGFRLRTGRLVHSLSPAEVRALETRAVVHGFTPLHSLVSYWRIDLRGTRIDPEDLVRQFRGLAGREVNFAYVEAPVGDPMADQDWTGQQGHRFAAPDGIDAAWAYANGYRGAGVRFMDLEDDWFPEHEDLPCKIPPDLVPPTLNMANDGKGTGAHGTAVLGVVAALDTGKGVTGIAPSVSSARMVSHYMHWPDPKDPTHTKSNGHVASAITAAIPLLGPGDVLLLEVHRWVERRAEDFFANLPTEIHAGDMDAIRLAVAHGIVVVEAAANGFTDQYKKLLFKGVPLDDFKVDWDGARIPIFYRPSGGARVVDSGAILVGAAASARPHERSDFSNYGSGIDCFAWGGGIHTTGEGAANLTPPGTPDAESYRKDFDGTSGAAAIIAGAALVVQGAYKRPGWYLSSPEMRERLSDRATGTKQGGLTNELIGVMPDLKRVIPKLGLFPDIYVRDAVGDAGSVPGAGAISASPDVIVTSHPVADEGALFGPGSGTENSDLLGDRVRAGQDNYVYVRMRNRGSGDAAGTTASVYWSEAATLVTPDQWELIGTSGPVTVPQGDTLVVSPAIRWPAARIPGSGHYCFIALVSCAADPAPPFLPVSSDPEPWTWEDFEALIRNHNNVTWRNFNVIDVPPAGAFLAETWFLVRGAPDRARVFDLELVQRLPLGLRLEFEVPRELGALLPVSDSAELAAVTDGMVRIEIPMLPHLRVARGPLAKGARHRCRLIVRGSADLGRTRPMIALRQVFEGLEVGRITWALRGEDSPEE